MTDLVERLKPYGPQKIILFGSRAKGTATPESDYDVIMVWDTPIPTRFQRMETVAPRIARFGAPLDLLIYTPTDRDPLWKLVDLSRDPYGQRDLSKERPEVLVPLQRELKEFLRQDRLRWLDAQDRVVARIEQ